MIIGKPEHFEKAHYEANRGRAPAHLAELVVYCLELVAQLAHRRVVFRFKGGNSLLVMLEDPQRFSIDVDIVTDESKEALIEHVGAIAEGCEAFTRWEARAPKTKPWLPMISFKVFFDSVYQAPEDAFVMLDCVLQGAPYDGKRKPVRCGRLYESNEVVEVPSVSGLIGDKLLTLGPSTLGIPLGKGKEAHRLKHVFDVALLSRQGYDLEAVRRSVAGCMEQESRIQERQVTLAEIVEDTIRFVSEPLEHAVQPSPEAFADGTYMREVALGFDAFREGLFGREYTWGAFREDCEAIAALTRSL